MFDAALEVVVDGAHVVRRVAVRHEAAPRSDDERQVLDAHRALVLAGAARRALPEHLFAVELAELRLALPGEQRVLRLQDERLRVELLARAPRRTVHLTAAALDAGERVEHGLASEILQRLEADLLLLEVEVRQPPELRRLEEHGDRRQHQVKVLRRRNERQERQDDDGSASTS